MENQHRKITGYRELSQEEINAMNELKLLGARIEATIDTLQMAAPVDQRWVAIGKTDMQTGLMALVRAVARPESF